ncbi:hypothetical protein TSUD_125920 [Trifolium subterraneum]|uniref:Uncharacterized protein n=1 Tax=Trifolium subterraneum TaxID=3900 RepID=A0A2Z6M699_TRISU|nr:hypothetical protein TSUD_125920 [Trifolium subterraneum]
MMRYSWIPAKVYNYTLKHVKHEYLTVIGKENKSDAKAKVASETTESVTASNGTGVEDLNMGTKL